MKLMAYCFDTVSVIVITGTLSFPRGLPFACSGGMGFRWGLSGVGLGEDVRVERYIVFS